MTPFDQAKERGNIAYVLIGALAASGSILLLAERNTRSANELAIETASEAGREQNIAALNMLKTLIAFPVANPSPRDRAHVPAIFPDTYVNTGAPLRVMMKRLAVNQPAASTNFWSVADGGPGAGTISIKGLDPRFRGGASQGSGFFAAQAAALVPVSTSAMTTTTRILQVVPVYGTPPAKPASLITAYDVTAESTVPVSRRDPGKGTRKITTKARINVDAPPTPQCDIVVTLGTGGPAISPSARLVPGTRLRASMRTYGVALSASASVPNGLGGRTSQSLTLSDEAKSVRSTLNGGVVVKTWDLSATSTHFEAGAVVMKVTGRVTGVNQASSSCERAIRVDAGAVVSRQAAINFEDRPFTGDRDYNDAVLCFNADVSVQSQQVVSQKNQYFVPVINKISACDAAMKVSVIGPDTHYFTIGPFLASRPPPLRFWFPAGARLHVSSNPGTCGDQPAGDHSMYNPVWAGVGAVCNLTGK